MSEEERFQLVIYMEGEYDKDPNMFPFPKEMIEEYILNSAPLKKQVGDTQSIDVTQNSNAKKQNRLLLAKKKIKSRERSRSKKPTRPQTATVQELPKPKPVRKGYGQRKGSVKGKVLKSPTRENRTPNISHKRLTKRVTRDSEPPKT